MTKPKTVDELFNIVWKKHWDCEQFRKSGWAREAKNNYHKNLKPAFGHMNLSIVTPGKVRLWLDGYKDKKYAGNRSLEILSKMFSYAEEREFIERGTNPCPLVKAFTESKRKRYASELEIKRIGELLEQKASTHPSEVAFIYLLMFSGSRPRAIERATWDELKVFALYDKPYGVLTFKGKSTETTGEDEIVVLPPQAMRVIIGLPRDSKTITGIKMPSYFWRKLRAEAGCKDLWARDWRRTYSTVGLSNGISLDVIGKLLNHKSAQTTKRYGEILPGARIEAAATIAREMEKLLVGTPEHES